MAAAAAAALPLPRALQLHAAASSTAVACSRGGGGGALALNGQTPQRDLRTQDLAARLLTPGLAAGRDVRAQPLARLACGAVLALCFLAPAAVLQQRHRVDEPRALRLRQPPPLHTPLAQRAPVCW